MVQSKLHQFHDVSIWDYMAQLKLHLFLQPKLHLFHDLKIWEYMVQSKLHQFFVSDMCSTKKQLEYQVWVQKS
jgi:hypothetical protein